MDPDKKTSREASQGLLIQSKDLFGEHKRIMIRHGDTFYRLMITRQGKLILNK